ncbi:hypothetical protein ACIBO9_35195 [Streptomyces prunicolor]|uniref:hypothetical protein n=1 Tax=Streptomyces prunicolor TaxID=67348 RepID=UPI0037D057C8
MYIASNLWESAATWGIVAGLFGTILGAILSAYLPIRFSRSKKKQIEFRWVRSTPLKPSTVLTVRHGTVDLDNPRLVDVGIRNSNDDPLTSESFHNGRPIVIELDAKIIDILEKESHPETAEMPTSNIVEGRRIEIEPCLLASGQTFVMSVLVDGRGQPDQFKFQSPLIGIAPKKMPSFDETMDEVVEQAQKFRSGFVGVSILVICLLSVLIPIFVHDQGKIDSVQSKYSRLKDCVIGNQGLATGCLDFAK